MHLPPLIQDLGLILMAAAVMTLIFKKLNQPVVLGYLLAGFLVSKHFPYLPLHIQDDANIQTWSEIGVIFMLFGLGLEFSFKKLFQMGKTVSITGVFEISFMLVTGYVVGQMLGWNWRDSLFLGAMLSMSSTTIIVKVLGELGLKTKSFASIVFGVLVVEDLLAVLLMVILGAVSVGHVSGQALMMSSLSLVFFLILWFLLGIFLVPAFLRFFRNILTDEILLVVSAGLCFMMVIVAVKAGFSAALGAFVMGSILAETSKGTRIERLILPVKDLFSAVFFVSVGMMINPAVVGEYFGIILLIAGVTILGKFFGMTLGALISGCNVKNAAQAGMSMAQIGEFSFIIAGLGMSLGVISDFLYPVAVAVSAVTTMTSPFLIKNSDRVSNWLVARIPSRVRAGLTRYEAAMTEPSAKESVMSLIWRVYGVKVLLNSVVVVAITLAVHYVSAQFLGMTFVPGKATWENLGACAVTLVLAGPFLWAVFWRRPVRPGRYDAETLSRLQQLQLGMSIVRFAAGCLLVGLLISSFTTIHALSGTILISLLALSLFLFSHRFEPVYQKIESRFLSNLSEKERAALEARLKHFELAPWDVSLTEYVLSQDSPLVLKTLVESGLKRDFGVTVAMIERGALRMIPPRPEDVLLPFDKVYLLGTETQLAEAQKRIEWHPESAEEPGNERFGLVPIQLGEEHPFAGKRIRECGLRESVNGLIVGIERNKQRHLNPEPSMILLPGDVVWLMGDRTLLNGEFGIRN